MIIRRKQFRQGMNLLLDNKEKILENRQLALAILSEEIPELSEEKNFSTLATLSR